MNPNQPAPSPVSNYSSFVPTGKDFPAEINELSRVLTKSYFDLATAINFRTIGTYDQGQYVTGNRWFNTGDPSNRLQSFRQVYSLATLPNTTTATIPTNINIDANTKFVYIYGIADNGTISIQLTPWNITRTDDAPYLDVNRSTGNIEITTSTANWIGYSATIVLEYILNN